MKSWAWAAICISIASLGAMTSAAGCSSDDPPAGDSDEDEDGNGGSGQGGNNTGNTGNMPVTSGTTTGSGTGPGPSSTGSGPVSCEDTGEFEACIDCCTEEFPDGADVFVVSLLTNCACEAAAPCLMQCNTMDPNTDICNDDGTLNDMAMDIDQGCIECINMIPDMDACINAFVMECQASQPCVDWATCREPCFDLPGAP